MYVRLLLVFIQLCLISVFEPLIKAENLCDQCVCTAHDEESETLSVNCDMKNLDSVPSVDIWPPNIYSLHLSHSNITSLTNLEKNEQIKSLDLDSSNLKSITPKVFSAYPNLNFLDISQNDIYVLHWDVFYGLENLLGLNMSHNNVKLLPNNIFEPLVKLKELKLVGNPLRYLDIDLFKPLQYVYYLDISNIDAHSLSDGLFHSMENLKILDLSKNEFEEVPWSALKSATSLKELYFNENPIKEFDENSFKGLTQLEYLELNDLAQLRRIKKLTFSSLKSLQSLKMIGNSRLDYIDPSAFDGLYNPADKYSLKLNSVFLRNNALTTLDNNMLPWCMLQTMDLQGNRWYCDCYMKWIINCSIPAELTVNLRCSGPRSNRGTFLTNLRENDFVCLHENTPYYYSQTLVKTVAAITGLVIVLLVVIGFVLFIKRHDIRSWWSFRRRGTGAVYYVKAQTNPTDQVDL